jgi:Hemerythrin HHE cation binding domain
MSRPNYFSNIHKAVRAGLFEASLQVARTDFVDPAAATAAAREIVELMDFLDEHAGHEQRFVFPELASFAPALAASLEAEHIKLEMLQTKIRDLAHRAHGSSSKDREEAGRMLARALALLVSDQLRHLDREETEANAAAWANRTDAELARVHARAQAAMLPETRERFTRKILQALNVREQEELLSGARKTLPASAFGALVTLAREVLGPERWAVLGSRLEPRRRTLTTREAG